jgi:AsmA protein
MSDIAMTLRAEDGLVQLEPFSLGLYGGLLDGGLALDVRRDTPAVSLTQNVSGLEVGDLLADLLGDRYLSGQTALSLSLSTQGDDWKRLLRALDGSLKLGIDNGSLRESEFVRGLAQAVGFFKPEAATQAESLSFQSLAGTASIDGGILSSDNLAFASESLSGSGDGRIDLAAQAIDYTLSLTEAGGDPRKSVPLRITGALTDPSVKLDLEAALKREAERAVQEQQERLERKVDEKVEELEQKAGEELEQKLRDALPGFLR